MVHKIKSASHLGIEKYAPVKFQAFDFTDDTFRSVDVYPQSKTVVIHGYAYEDDFPQVREFSEIIGDEPV